MTRTSIEWTDHSINPIRARLGDAVGHYCEKVSPGCKNCYSSRLQRRFGMPEFQEQRSAGVEPFLDASKLAEVLHRKKPTTWFWENMSDLFGEWVPNEWIAACFGVMVATPWHTHQVLTKRALRMREWFRWASHDFALQQRGIACAPNVARAMLDAAAEYLGTKNETLNQAWRGFAEVDPWPLPNVWLGVSAEDQKHLDERWPHLRDTPAAVRFLSYEPALGPLNAARCLPCAPPCGPPIDHGPALDWVIAGSESGPRARPAQVEWFRSVRDACAAVGVPFFLKQAAVGDGITEGLGSHMKYSGGSRSLRPGLIVTTPRPSGIVTQPYLDGVQHKEFPR